MKDTDIDKLIELQWGGGAWLPFNQNAHDLAGQSRKNDVVAFKNVTQRDLKFHKCYMALLRYIWQYLPKSFQKAVPEKNFYIWLKHLKGQYKVLFQFQDGTRMVEYDSISFSRLNENGFHDYVKEQLPYIYTEVIGKYFEGEIYDSIIENIETEFEKFFAKL